MTQRRDDVELGQRASSRNGGAAQTRQVIVIGVRDALANSADDKSAEQNENLLVLSAFLNKLIMHSPKYDHRK